MVTMPPDVVRTRASSTVFVKASSLVNLDLAGMATVEPGARRRRRRASGKAAELCRALASQPRSRGAAGGKKDELVQEEKGKRKARPGRESSVSKSTMERGYTEAEELENEALPLS